MPNCPRCRQPLTEGQVDEFAVNMCQPCRGIFLPHRDLTTILDRSWQAITRERAEQTMSLPPENWQSEPVLKCPRCVARMDKYGYMGLATIQLDRCNCCEAIWLDADELENMLVALARTNYRSESALRREREASRNIVSAGMAGLAAKGGHEGDGVPVGGALTAAQILLRLLR